MLEFDAPSTVPSPADDRAAWFVHHAVAAPAVPAALADLLKLLGGAAPGPNDADVIRNVPVRRVRTGELLVQEGAECDAICVVRSGAFKCYKTSEDGYEQVLGFVAAGEVVGFEAISGGRHPASTLALEDSIVFTLPLRELDRWRAASPALDRALQVALSRRLARAVEVAEMMAPVAAEARLSRFLLWLSDWMAQRGQSPRRLLLRMSRRDIASLLGVAHETVSRSFTALAAWGSLKVDIREVEILDTAKLRACARNTRGLPEDLPSHALVPRRRVAARTALAAA